MDFSNKVTSFTLTPYLSVSLTCSAREYSSNSSSRWCPNRSYREVRASPEVGINHRAFISPQKPSALAIAEPPKFDSQASTTPMLPGTAILILTVASGIIHQALGEVVSLPGSGSTFSLILVQGESPLKFYSQATEWASLQGEMDLSSEDLSPQRPPKATRGQSS